MVQRSSDNTQGAIFMAISMFGYVVNDTMVKLAAEELQLYQTIFLRGFIITLIIAVIARRTTRLTDLRHHLSYLLVLRVAAEVIGTIAFLNALVRLPIANVTAILQVVPLAVTLAAALFLGEKVGWRRYVAIGVGFLGVVVIVRPDAGGFSQFTLLALVAVVMVTIRDLATRRLPPEVPSVLVAFFTAVSIAAMGLVLSIPQGWNPITSSAAIAILAASAFLTVGYLFSIRTVRIGDLSFAAPMRYTILLWAMLFGIFVFNEIPDAWTIAGSALIVASGLYSVARERSLGLSSPRRRVFKNRPGV